MKFPGVRTMSIGSPGGPGGGADLSFEFNSTNIEELRAISSDLKEALYSYTGVSDINDTFSGGSDEIQIDLTPPGPSIGHYAATTRSASALRLLWC